MSAGMGRRCVCGARGTMLLHGPSILGVDTERTVARRGIDDLEPIGRGCYRRARGKTVFRPLWDITRMTGQGSRAQVIF